MLIAEGIALPEKGGGKILIINSPHVVDPLVTIGARAAGNAAAAVESGQPDTADYRNKLTEIRNIYHQEVRMDIKETQGFKIKMLNF